MKHSGIILNFNDIHGTGVIKPNGSGMELLKFSHKDITNCQGAKLPNEFQVVEFKIIQTKNGGVKASEIELIFNT